MKRFIYGILVLLTAGTWFCFAAPQPAVVQGPDEWTVDVRFEHPQQIILSVDGQGGASRFWYTIITVTNKAGRDVGFYPMCDLMTDTFQIIPAGKSTPASVFEQLKKRHKSAYPFLEFLERADNKILQGDDNAKDIAVIWPDFDARTKNMKIFIAGLSNETVAIDHPTAKDEMGVPTKVFLRKTLELSYSIAGDPALRSDAKLVYKGKRWIMR